MVAILVAVIPCDFAPQFPTPHTHIKHFFSHTVAKATCFGGVVTPKKAFFMVEGVTLQNHARSQQPKWPLFSRDKKQDVKALPLVGYVKDTFQTGRIT